MKTNLRLVRGVFKCSTSDQMKVVPDKTFYYKEGCVLIHLYIRNLKQFIYSFVFIVSVEMLNILPIVLYVITPKISFVDFLLICIKFVKWKVNYTAILD